MIATFLLCLPVTALPASPRALPDDAHCAARLQEPKPEKASSKKRSFPRLTSPDKRKVSESLTSLRKAKTEEDLAAARAMLAEVGSGAVPQCIKGFGKTEEERLPELVAVMDVILADEDLDLAWKEVDKRTAVAARSYLTRRVAQSEREDAHERLAALLEDPDAEVSYQAARGLAWRADAAALPILHGAVQKRWTKEKSLLRSDFAGVERGPLSSGVVSLMSVGSAKEKAAAVHLFELFGVKEQARSLKPHLDETNPQIRLAAINACRVVIDGDAPVEKAAITQIVEMAEQWKQRL